jgi:hypothetical protein
MQPPSLIMFRPLAARVLLLSRSSTRSFHSPYVALRDSRLPTPLASSAVSSMNEKQLDHSAEPFLTHAGTRTYVVSQPDATSKHYQVPSGAYPTSTPYVNSVASEPDAQARAAATGTVARNEGGIEDSSATSIGQGDGQRELGNSAAIPGVAAQGGLASAWRTRR